MRRRGHSLPELTVVLALAALIAALGVPPLLHVSDRGRVEAAARQLVLAHREARLAAVTSGRTALLRLGGDSIELRLARGDALPAARWRRVDLNPPGATCATLSATSTRATPW